MRTLFSLLCCALFFTSVAQYKLQVPVGWKGNQIRLHTIHGKDRQATCHVLVNEDSIRAIQLDADSRLQKQLAVKKHKNEVVLGGCIRGENIYIYTRRQYGESLYAYVFNTATGAVTEHTTPFKPGQEKLLDKISAGDHFLYLTINNKTDELVVYDFTSESAYATIRHKFNGNVWKNLSTSNFLNRLADVEKIDIDGEPHLNVVRCPNKLYLQGDTLYLLMDHNRSLTRIFSFYLHNQFVLERIMPHSGNHSETDAAYAANSFLFRDHLYFVQAANDSLWIDIADFRTGHILKTFAAGADGAIDFSNTPVLQTGSDLAADAERVLNKSSQFLHRMMAGEPFIMVTPYDREKVSITVGAAEKIKSASWSAPNHFSVNRWLKTTRFQMLLNASSHEQVPGKPANSINERVDYFKKTKALKIPPGAETLFFNNGKYYFVWYDKTGDQLVVQEFPLI